jgi:hypothetical protein
MANGYILLVLAPVIGLAVYCALHLTAAQFWRGPSPYPPLVGAFLPGLIATAVVSGYALYVMQAPWLDVVGYGVLNLTSYGALGWGYFHFVNLCIASLRIRVLEEIAEVGGEMDGAALLTQYNTDGMIGLRISRLTAGGHLVVREERYYSGKSQFLWAARFFELLRRLILGPQYLRQPTDPPRA